MITNKKTQIGDSTTSCDHSFFSNCNHHEFVCSVHIGSAPNFRYVLVLKYGKINLMSLSVWLYVYVLYMYNLSIYGGLEITKNKPIYIPCVALTCQFFDHFCVFLRRAQLNIGWRNPLFFYDKSLWCLQASRHSRLNKIVDILGWNSFLSEKTVDLIERV